LALAFRNPGCQSRGRRKSSSLENDILQKHNKTDHAYISNDSLQIEQLSNTHSSRSFKRPYLISMETKPEIMMLWMKTKTTNSIVNCNQKN
jgi:hypothetical protein